MGRRRGAADDGVPVRRRRERAYKRELKDLAEAYNSNGKRTVLLACDAFFPVTDGVIHVVDNYARELAKKMNVLVLVPATRGKVYLRDYPVLGVCSMFSAKLNYQVALPAFDGRAKKILKKFRIDLIHCHSPFFIGRYVLKLHKKRDIPMIATFHSQYRQDFVKYVGDGALTRFLMRFIMKTFNGSDEVWTMNEASGAILRTYGYQGDIRIVPNGTSFAPPADYERERAEAREKFGAGDGLVFIFVGRLILQKNILFLASVLGELKRRGLSFRMLFAGDGPDRGKLEEKLREEKVADRAVFTGRLGMEELYAVYAAADLFLFPSMYDTFGLVKTEAASRKTPTAFTENSAASCGVTDNVDGFLLPADPSAFAEGILRIVSDREKLAKAGENAMRDLYATWDKILCSVEGYYTEILSGRKKA